MEGQFSQRAIILLIVGAATAYLSYRDPALGVALGVGVVVVALLHQLMSK